MKIEKDPPICEDTILAIVAESLLSMDLQSSSLLISGLNKALMRNLDASRSMSKNVTCRDDILVYVFSLYVYLKQMFRITCVARYIFLFPTRFALGTSQDSKLHNLGTYTHGHQHAAIHTSLIHLAKRQEEIH